MHQLPTLPNFGGTLIKLDIALFKSEDISSFIYATELYDNCGFLYLSSIDCRDHFFKKKTVPLLRKIASWANTNCDIYSTNGVFSYMFISHYFTNEVNDNLLTVGFKPLGKPVKNRRTGNMIQCYRVYIPTLLKLTKPTK